MDLIRAAKLLVGKISRDYADDVSLVVVMGSYVHGATHARSDLDLYLVPKTSRGYNLGFTFILNRIGFDFWAVSWERLERIAGNEEQNASIITDGEVLYCASEDDGRRFECLRERAQRVGDRAACAQRAELRLREAWPALVRMGDSGSLPQVRGGAISVLYAVTGALAALNNTVIRRGRGLLKREVLAMPLVPERFAEMYDVVFASDDADSILRACRDLALAVAALVVQEQAALGAPVPFKQRLAGWYEEAINCYNKLYHACEAGDAVTALFAGAELEHELQAVLAGTEVRISPLPDLVEAYEPRQLERYAEAAREHQSRLEAFLQAQGVEFLVFTDWEALEAHLDSL